MKTILIILLLSFGLGCAQSVDDVQKNPLKIAVIEGCEYFLLSAYPPGTYTLCHKGNCTNHQNKVVIP